MPMTAALGLGCVKTKSHLVVMPSEGRIFAFFCSERDHKPQNSGCGYTTQSFHTAWAKRRHGILVLVGFRSMKRRFIKILGQRHVMLQTIRRPANLFSPPPM